MSAECALRCVGLTVDHPGTRALDDVDLTVAHGEVMALLGASGSGKSTLLHAVAGLVQPTAGEVWLDGLLVADARRSVPPERRGVGLVFQDFALWPHLTTLETVAYPLRRAGRSRAAARATALRLLAELDLADLADRHPAQLSGGQQQRVGLARALAREPRLFLLDEPTAHLDTHLRGAFQDSVRERQAETGTAAIYATHDAGEALALADRVALLVAGRLAQVGTPHHVYSEPVDAAAAALTGPGTIAVAVVAADPDGLVLDLGDGPVVVAGGGTREPVARPRRVLVRPDWAYLDGPWRARIAARAFRGPHTDYRLDTAGGPVLVRVPGEPDREIGDEVGWGLRRAWVVGDGSVDRGERPGVLEPLVDHVEV